MCHFDKREVLRWRRTVWREFQRWGFDAPKIPAAMVLAAVAAIGTDAESLIELTGSSKEYVRMVLRRLRKHRVLSGQTLRTAWESKDQFHGYVALMLDSMVAAGELQRPVDTKRSEAQKKRDPSTRRHGTTRRPRITVAGPFTPAMQRSDPYYQLTDEARRDFEQGKYNKA